MTGMQRHTDWYDVVFLANLVESCCKMTVVAIEDQKTMFPFRLTYCMGNKVFLESINNFIYCPAVWTNLKSLMLRKVVKPSYHEVFSLEDNV